MTKEPIKTEVLDFLFPNNEGQPLTVKEVVLSNLLKTPLLKLFDLDHNRHFLPESRLRLSDFLNTFFIAYGEVVDIRRFGNSQEYQLLLRAPRASRSFLGNKENLIQFSRERIDKLSPKLGRSFQVSDHLWINLRDVTFNQEAKRDTYKIVKGSFIQFAAKAVPYKGVNNSGGEFLKGYKFGTGDVVILDFVAGRYTLTEEDYQLTNSEIIAGNFPEPSSYISLSGYDFGKSTLATVKNGQLTKVHEDLAENSCERFVSECLLPAHFTKREELILEYQDKFLETVTK